MLLLPGACSKHCGAKSDVEEWDGGMGAPLESHHGATEAWVLPEVLRCFEFRQVLRCFLNNLRKGDQKGETNCGGGFDKTLDGLTSETQHSASCLHLLFLPWCFQCFINHLNQWTSLLESGKHAAFFIAPIRQGIPPPKSPRSFPGHHQDVISTGSASWLIVVGFSLEPQSCMVTNPCFQTLLLSKAVLLGRKASLSGLRRAFVRSLDRPLDQSVVWPAMLVRIRACLFLFFFVHASSCLRHLRQLEQRWSSTLKRCQ